MSNDIIKILLQAEVEKSSVENIKSQLSGIQTSVKPIKIDIQTNDNQTQATLNKIKETQQQLSSLKSKPMQLIDVQELQKSGAEFERYYKSLDNTMNKISNSYKNMGRVTIEGQKFDEVTKEVNKFTVKVEEAEGVVKKYTYTLKQLLETDGQSHGKGSLAFVLEDIKGLDKSAEVAEKNLKQMHDVRTKLSQEEVKAQNDVDNAIQKTIQSREKENKLLEERQSLAANRGKDETYKQQIKDEQDLLKFKREARALVDAEDKKLEEQRLATTTNTQARIERAITGSNETISQQQARMNRANARDYEQVWLKAYKNQENATQILQEKIDLFQQKMRGNMDIFADKNKGKYDESQLDALRQRMETLSTSSGNAAREMKEITTEMGHMSKAANKSNSVLANITENFMKFARFYLVGQQIVNFRNAVKDGVNSVKELDTSLTELNKITSMSEQQMKLFVDRAYDAGVTIARTGKEVVDATVEWRRAGFAMEEAFELAQKSLLLTNVGSGINDVVEASSSMIAILKGFKMEAEDATHIVDALNEVSNNYAVDTVNLTEILKRVSGTMAQTGTSYEQLIGLGVGAFESLRNSEKVASGKIFCPYVQKCA